MAISNVAKIRLIPLIIGQEGLTNNRISEDLVNFFNDFGFRDDVYNGVLPKLGESTLNTSKKQYVNDRILKTEEKNIKDILIKIISESNDSETCLNVINEILATDHYQIKKKEEGYEFIGIAIEDPAKIDAQFRDIQNRILDLLENAEATIWIAMAWFTNQAIRDKLLEKRQQGIRIELVIFKDGVNHVHGVDLSSFNVLESKGTRGGIMHDKFCIIDTHIVISGSYNWSSNAEYRNDETIVVTEDFATAKMFAKEFRRLKPLAHEH